MKKTLIFIFIISFLKVYSQQSDWKYITGSKDNVEYFFKPKSHNTAWTKQVSKKVKYYTSGNVKSLKTIDGYEIVLYKFDCSEKKLGLGSSVIYSKLGDVIKSTDIDEYEIEMFYIIPDSVGETILNSFCAK
ncbi:surface-adhesin E family protein [Chryseobacterium aquaticum]|uniref:surface-adhesin E family protein n=1 Tax=Chryseobacterium aquaticum TaxID=452084 RepID=UPI003F702914